MQCKLADSVERLKAFAQVHAVWPHDPDPAVHLEKRLASVQHQRATWFVARDGGDVVSSLGAYPVQLYGPDGERPARALGAVFTPEHHRGLGYAAKLVRFVKDYYAEQGVLDFILYSDIAPIYYQRLGFQRLPSFIWSWELRGPFLSQGTSFQVEAAHPMQPGPMKCPFGLKRGIEDDAWVQDKQNAPLRLAWELGKTGELTGKWLLSRKDHGTYSLLESNVSQTAADWESFRALVTRDAEEAGCHSVKGWWTSPEALPDSKAQPEITARREEILMWSTMRGASDPWLPDITRHGFRAFLSEHV